MTVENKRVVRLAGVSQVSSTIVAADVRRRILARKHFRLVTPAAAALATIHELSLEVRRQKAHSICFHPWWKNRWELQPCRSTMPLRYEPKTNCFSSDFHLWIDRSRPSRDSFCGRKETEQSRFGAS